MCTGTWEQLIAAGDIPAARVAHTAMAVDRKIIVFGGRSGSVRFDPVWLHDTTEPHGVLHLEIFSTASKPYQKQCYWLALACFYRPVYWLHLRQLLLQA